MTLNSDNWESKEWCTVCGYTVGSSTCRLLHAQAVPTKPKKVVDPKSYELAEYFLASETHTERDVRSLAEDIQTAAEGWFGNVRDEQEPDFDRRSERDEWLQR